VSGNGQVARPEGDRHAEGYAPACTARPPLELPQQVSIALAELAGAARKGLLAWAVGTGLQVMHLLMDECPVSRI